MTSTTTSLIFSGRALPEPAESPRSSSPLQTWHRRLARRRYVAARRAQARQDLTDGYLDRRGMASVDWQGVLAAHVAR